MKADIARSLRAAEDAIRRGQEGEARRHWQQALSIDPEHAAARNGLGMLALRAGKVDEALDNFRRATESEPTAAVLRLNYAKAARTAGDSALEKAILSSAAELEPLSLIVNVRLAELAERMGEPKEAGTRWRAVVAIAAGMNHIPADARAAVDHGRAFVAAQAQELEARINDTLAAQRERSSPSQRRRVEGAIDHMFGRRTIYLNQCTGLHIPFLPADEFFEREMFPWLSDLESATSVIRAELVGALNDGLQGFEPYVSLPPGTPDNVWTPLDRSPDWSTLHLWRHGARDDAVCGRFPRTAAVVDRLPLAHLPGRMPTVFFSVLAPRAHIPPHTGVTNARAIVHLPLIVPPGCRFRVGGETRAWVEGEAFAFDDTIEHEAWNDSDQARVVLILDTWNPHLTPTERDFLVDFYAASGADAVEI